VYKGFEGLHLDVDYDDDDINKGVLDSRITLRCF